WLMSSPSTGLSLQSDDGQSRERSAALHVRRGELQLPAGESDQAPAGEVLVAAVDRVGEHPFHRVRAHGVEEGGRRGPGELARLALLEAGEALVWWGGGEPGEGFLLIFGEVGGGGGEPGRVKLLRVGVGARQR